MSQESDLYHWRDNEDDSGRVATMRYGGNPVVLLEIGSDGGNYPCDVGHFLSPDEADRIADALKSAAEKIRAMRRADGEGKCST